MMPEKPLGIMQYVREVEGKYLALKNARERVSRKVFWCGFAWGAGITAPVCWFILKHGG